MDVFLDVKRPPLIETRAIAFFLFPVLSPRIYSHHLSLILYMR